MVRNGVQLGGGNVEWEHRGWARFALHRWGCVCVCVRPSQLPGAPPKASPGLGARQDLRPKGLGGNGGVRTFASRPSQRNPPRTLRYERRFLLSGTAGYSSHRGREEKRLSEVLDGMIEDVWGILKNSNKTNPVLFKQAS